MCHWLRLRVCVCVFTLAANMRNKSVSAPWISTRLQLLLVFRLNTGVSAVCLCVTVAVNELPKLIYELCKCITCKCVKMGRWHGIWWKLTGCVCSYFCFTCRHKGITPKHWLRNIYRTKNASNFLLLTCLKKNKIKLQKTDENLMFSVIGKFEKLSTVLWFGMRSINDLCWCFWDLRIKKKQHDIHSWDVNASLWYHFTASNWFVFWYICQK